MASIMKRGKMWYFRYTDADGRRIMRKAGPDRKTAELAAAVAEAEAARNRPPEPFRRGKIDPYVYFVQAVATEGLIKIGLTSRPPNKRLQDLMAHSPVPLVPLGLMPGGRDKEAAIHCRFLSLHSHAEWFRPDPELLRYIDEKASPWPEKLPQLQPISLRYRHRLEMEAAIIRARKVRGIQVNDPA